MLFQQKHNHGLRQLFLKVSCDSALSAAHLTFSLHLCTSVARNWSRMRAPWRGQCQLKTPIKGLRIRLRSCWEERRRKSFPQRGVIYLPFRQIDEFFACLVLWYWIYLRPPCCRILKAWIFYTFIDFHAIWGRISSDFRVHIVFERFCLLSGQMTAMET